VGFTRALRLELAGTGIQASVVFPAGVRTDWAASTEGGALLPLFSESGSVIKRIAAEQNLPLPPVEGILPAETVARSIVDCILQPRAEVYPHRGVREFSVMAARDIEEAERYQLAVALGEREVYLKMKRG
jgi:short-subunit dehydrogenase